MRERALRLVHTKLKTNTSDLLNKEAQAQVITEVSRSYLNISPAVDCGDQEGFRLRHRHWRRVPETDGDPQHDLLAKVHRWPGKLFRFIHWSAPIWHFEFRRRWLRWWPPWLTLTWPRTLTMPGTDSPRSYLQDFSYIFQRWGDGPIVAVCHSRPPILLGICESFLWSQGYWKGPERYWPPVRCLQLRLPSIWSAKFCPTTTSCQRSRELTPSMFHWDIVSNHFLFKLKIPSLTAQDCALQADRRDVPAPGQVEQPWRSC